MQIVEYVRSGFSKKEIADALSIAVRTVENHMREIYVRTKSRSATQLVCWYLEMVLGIRPPHRPPGSVVEMQTFKRAA